MDTNKGKLGYSNVFDFIFKPEDDWLGPTREVLELRQAGASLVDVESRAHLLPFARAIFSSPQDAEGAVAVASSPIPSPVPSAASAPSAPSGGGSTGSGGIHESPALSGVGSSGGIGERTLTLVMEKWAVRYLKKMFRSEAELRECIVAAVQWDLGRDAKERAAKDSFVLWDGIVVEEAADQGSKLIDKAFVYAIVPDSLKVLWSGSQADLKGLDARNVRVQVPSVAATVVETDNSRSEVVWFGRFLLYCKTGKADLGLDGLQVQHAIGLLSEEGQLHGIEDLTLQMREGFRLFEQTTTLPRGVLLHGPPGTGKTTIIKLLCDFMNIKLVGPMMAAGDFAKPLVGQSEKMINSLADRAARIPWRLCAVVVDEIETLVETREGEGGSSGSKLSVLLSRIGGMGDTPNLMFFAATNHPETMDAAFMRRMKIKLFVGPPSRSGREAFLREKGADIFGKPHECDAKCGEPGCALRQCVVAATINFASSHLMGVIQRLRSSAVASSASRARGVAERCRDALAVVSRYCEQEGLLLSSMNPAKLAGSRDDEAVDGDAAFFSLFDPLYKGHHNCSGRVVLDLGASSNHVWVHLATRNRSAQQDLFLTKKLKSLSLTALSNDQRTALVEELVKCFGGVDVLRDAVSEYVSSCQLLQELDRAQKTASDAAGAGWREFQAMFAELERGGLTATQIGRMFAEERRSAGSARKAGRTYVELKKRLEEKAQKVGSWLEQKVTAVFPLNRTDKHCLKFSLKLQSPTIEDAAGVACRMAWWADSLSVVVINLQMFHSHNIADEQKMQLYLHNCIQDIQVKKVSEGNVYFLLTIVESLAALLQERGSGSGSGFACRSAPRRNGRDRHRPARSVEHGPCSSAACGAAGTVVCVRGATSCPACKGKGGISLAGVRSASRSAALPQLWLSCAGGRQQARRLRGALRSVARLPIRHVADGARAPRPRRDSLCEQPCEAGRDHGSGPLWQARLADAAVVVLLAGFVSARRGRDSF